MNSIKNAQNALATLQESVIGLFKINGTNQAELVIKKDGALLKTVCVGSLGGISTTSITINRGTLVMFDAGETLANLKGNPFKLEDYTKRLNIKR